MPPVTPMNLKEPGLYREEEEDLGNVAKTNKMEERTVSDVSEGNNPWHEGNNQGFLTEEERKKKPKNMFQPKSQSSLTRF